MFFEVYLNGTHILLATKKWCQEHRTHRLYTFIVSSTEGQTAQQKAQASGAMTQSPSVKVSYTVIGVTHAEPRAMCLYA